MKPMNEKQAVWWREKRTKGFLSFIKFGLIFASLFFPLFLFGRFLFFNPPPIYLWFLITMAAPLGILIGQIVDWWRYERKYQNHLQNSQH
jgi:hypothetical protein